MHAGTSKIDVIIVGGSHAGLSLAAGLGTAGFRVVCLERNPPPVRNKKTRDGRTLALSHRSMQFLKTAGVWPLLSAQTCPILNIRVADQDSRLSLAFDCADVGSDPFGYIIENDLFMRSLEERISHLKNVKLIHQATVEAIEINKTQRIVRLTDGRCFAAPLVVAADGRSSRCRALMGLETYGWDYHQTAIVVTIAHDKPHHNVAVEHFHPGGPFATLPMTKQRSSIVWTEKTEAAQILMAMTEKEFTALLQKKVEPYLGSIKLIGSRFSHPLTLQHAKYYTAPRFVLVGDAAHGIHPIAGQGLNIGMGDIEDLVKELTYVRQLGLDLGDPSFLRRYEKSRKFDNGNMVLMTDILDRLFSNSHPTIQIVRRLGLGMVQKWPRLRKFFMQTAMGQHAVGSNLHSTH